MKYEVSGHRSMRRGIGGHWAWDTAQLGNRRPRWPKQTEPCPWSQPPTLVLCGTHSIVRMENIGGRRVVHNQHPTKVSAQPAQVLHVVPSVEDARLTEQPRPEGPPLVQQVSYWICVLQIGGGSSGAEGTPEVIAQRQCWRRRGGQGRVVPETLQRMEDSPWRGWR